MSREFQKLSQFILKEMQMQHICQPVMLIELLMNKGAASVTDIAKALIKAVAGAQALSVHDPKQVKHYEGVTRAKPGHALTDSRGVTRMEKDTYSLIGFEELTGDEIMQLIAVCEDKIQQFIEKQGSVLVHSICRLGWAANNAGRGALSPVPGRRLDGARRRSCVASGAVMPGVLGRR